ncbi:ras family domain-containing protein [Phthorimaea operculella]|nr:ras family domain-containing protein [Phthorimaea operculella]
MKFDARRMTKAVAQNGSTTLPRSHHQRTGRPPAAPKSYDYLLKVLLVGDSDVGKQEILQDLEDGSADSPFCSGSAYKTTTILLDGKRVKLQLWDTSGQGRFCTIIRSYSRGAQGILLVYDITNKWSFDSIDRWLEEVEKHAPGVPKVLVGNRLHLAFKRQVQEREAEQYAAKNRMAFFEVSPLCDFNIRESFCELSRMALHRNGMERLWRSNKGIVFVVYVSVFIVNRMAFFEVSPLCDFNIRESFCELSRMALHRNGMERL